MSDISPSAIQTDAEFERLVSEAASSEEIKKLMLDRALAQNLVRRDEFNPSVILPVEKPATAARVAHRVTINGESHIFEGKDEAEANAAELAYLRSLTPPTAAQHRDDAVRFTADQGKCDEAAAQLSETEAAELIRRTQLETDFKAGRVSTEQFLLESGALQRAIDARAEQIRAEEKNSTQFKQSWADATEEFKRAHPEWDQWATEENKMKMAETLLAMGATDVASVENMNRAYHWLKENNKLVESPDYAVQKKISSANSVEEIRNALNSPGARSSGYFGGR
jgi:hypothetical protein